MDSATYKERTMRKEATNAVRRLTAVGFNMTLSAPAIAAAVVLLCIKII
jgi:hypothetical protein